MNYGLTALGATLVIVHFLRLCGVMGNHDQGATYREIQQEYFKLSNGGDDDCDTDDTIRGWLTQDPQLKARNLILKIWTAENNSTDLSSFETFFAYPTTTRILANEDVNEEAHGRLIGAERELLCNFQDESQNSRTTVEYNSGDESLPDGCRFLNANKTLICDQASRLPPLPPKLELFELLGTQIRVIGRAAFGETEIKTVKIHGNELLCLHPYAFESVTGLRILSIGDNNLEYIRPEDFQSLNEVYMLYLEHNKINLVNHQSFNRPGHANNNSSDDDPAVLPSLIYLSLMGNPLGIIPRNYFQALRLSPLRTLKLTNCGLWYIQPGALSHLPMLTSLDLSENPALMSSLSNGFESFGSSNLKELFLASNNLASIPTDALTKVSSSLRTLDLSSNLFDSLGSTSFPPELTNLKSLNLNNCRIRSIHSDAFKNFLILETLTLANNQLSTIPSSVSFLQNLVHFDLTGNNPSSSSSVSIGTFYADFTLPANALTNLTKLKTLLMNKLPLHSVPSDAFRGLSNLEILSLGEAEIDTIGNFSFRGLKNLKFLNLNCNKLSKLWDVTFYGLEQLDTLYLEWNQIELPCRNELPTFPLPVLKSVEPFQGFSVFDGNGEEVPDESNATTWEPLRYMPMLKRLRLANNNIRRLNPRLFQHSPNLEQVDLSNNYIYSWSSPLILNGSVLGNFSVAHNLIGPVSRAMIMDFEAIQESSPELSPWSVDISENPLVCDSLLCEMMELVGNDTLKFNRLKEWTAYNCMDPATSKYHKVSELLKKFCWNKTTGGGDDGIGMTSPTYAPVELPETTPKSKVETAGFNLVGGLIMAFFCVSSIVGTVMIGYRKRFHLKYFCFVVRFNVVNLPNLSAAGKKRSSLAWNEYEYDIFLSYHHTDREFIQDQLVPYLEGDQSVDRISNCNNNSISSRHSTSSSFNVDVEAGGEALRICIHERDFQVGVPITENIVDCVDKSRQVVVVVSRNYLQSQWCLYEMNLAYHRLIESGRKSFVVILLEDIPSILRTKSLNYLLVSRTYLEWPGNEASAAERNTFWRRLSQSLRAHNSRSVSVSSK